MKEDLLFVPLKAGSHQLGKLPDNGRRHKEGVVALDGMAPQRSQAALRENEERNVDVGIKNNPEPGSFSFPSLLG